MSDTYTKLFRSIAASTIVSEPLATRWLWVTMLSQADKAGKVYGSVPGLARMANISLEECEAGLACFLSPDKYSRTAEHEGRRVEAIDGGWKLLNHAKYDAMRSEAERREYKREWDRTHRSKAAKAEADTGEQSDTNPTISDTPTETDGSDPSSQFSLLSSQEDQEQQHVQPSAAPCRFAEFWAVYPNHKSRKEAEKAWRKRKLDDRCDDLILHVMLMQAADDGWQRGFIPLGSTYINQDRWEDVPKRPPDSGPPAKPASQTRSAAETLLIGTSHAQRLDQRHDSPRLGEVVEHQAQRLPAGRHD